MSAGEPLLHVAPVGLKKWPKNASDQTLEVPPETSFKRHSTSYRVYNGPCQTNCLLHRARQTSKKGPKMLGWIKHWRYHLKPIANEYLHHDVYRMAHARQINCCKGPARQPPNMTRRPNIIEIAWGKYWKYHLQLTFSHILSCRVQEYPCQTNYLLHRARQTS